MFTNNLFRNAGWLAFASAVLMVAAVASFFFNSTIGGIFMYLFFLLLIGVFYALYIAHRPESKGLSLAGLILVFPAIGMAIAANLGGSTFLVSLWYLFFFLLFLIFGFLAFRSAKMPRGLAVVALLTGITYLISGVAGFLGNQVIAENVSTFASIFMLVWLVWLWRAFLSKKLATALPATVAN